VSRRAAVLVLVVLGGAAFVLSLLTWVSAEAATALGPRPVQVNGAQALPVAPSAALVVLVAGLATGLSGRLVRILAPVAAALASLVALIGTITLIGDPDPVARSAAGEIGGVREIAGPAELTIWPWVVAALLALTVLASIALPLLATRWTPAARKYERASGAVHDPDVPTARADWDSLSSGHDPSADQPQEGRGGEPDPPARGR